MLFPLLHNIHGIGQHFLIPAEHILCKRYPEGLLQLTGISHNWCPPGLWHWQALIAFSSQFFAITAIIEMLSVIYSDSIVATLQEKVFWKCELNSAHSETCHMFTANPDCLSRSFWIIQPPPHSLNSENCQVLISWYYCPIFNWMSKTRELKSDYTAIKLIIDHWLMHTKMCTCEYPWVQIWCYRLCFIWSNVQWHFTPWILI